MTNFMDTTITINRETIFSKTARRMDWEGTRSPSDANEYDRVAIAESDRALFHSLFDEAAMHAIDMCRPFMKKASNSDKALSLILSLSESADKEALTLTLENLLSYHVLALWLEIVAPDRASAIFSKRDDFAFKVQAILYHHPAPRRHP